MSHAFVDEALKCLKAGQSMFTVNTVGERRLVEAVRRVGWLWAKEGMPTDKLKLDPVRLNMASIAENTVLKNAGQLKNKLVSPAALMKVLDFLQRAPVFEKESDEAFLLGDGRAAIEYVLNVAGLPTYTWDLHDGFQGPPGMPFDAAGAARGELGTAFKLLGTFPPPDNGKFYPFPTEKGDSIFPLNCLIVFKDADTHICSYEKPAFRRAVRSMYEDSRLVCLDPRTRRHVFFVQPHMAVPESIRHCLVRLPFEAPGAKEIDAAITDIQQSISDPTLRECPTNLRSELIQSLRGLEQMNIDTALARCVVEFKGFVPSIQVKDPETAAMKTRRLVPTIRGMRSSMLSSSQGLKIYDPDDPKITGLGDLGGYENVRALAQDVLVCRSENARKIGLMPPTGFGIAGPPGTGKTVCGKLFAKWLGVPLVMPNMGTTKGQYVGLSEANMENNLNVIRALGQCVVLFDEWDKQAGGTTSSFSDGNTSSSMLSLVLDFASDPSREAFLIFTMNRLHGPIESLRAGRISDFFYTPLPGPEERAEIMRLKLVEQNATVTDELSDVAAENAFDGLSGAELNEVVNKACLASFHRCGRKEPTGAELLAARSRVTPVTKLNPDEVHAMASFKDIAVPVSQVRVKAAQPRSRKQISVE